MPYDHFRGIQEMKKGRQGEGGGRPKVQFTEEQVIEVQALASVLNKKQLADYFGICENTLRQIEERQPEVSEAYKKGRGKAIASVGMNLVQQSKKGNTAATIFYLKTQAGWRETDTNDQEIPQIVVNTYAAD